METYESIKRQKKSLAEQSLRLNINDLKKAGAFREDQLNVMSFIEWKSQGEIISSMDYCITRDILNENGYVLHLYSDRTDMNTEIKTKFHQEIEIVATPCANGAERLMFICPYSFHGDPCPEKVGVLYRPITTEHFGCRVCKKIVYDAQQHHRDWGYENITKPMRLIHEMYDILDEMPKHNIEWYNEQEKRILSKFKKLMKGDFGKDFDDKGKT